MAFPFEDLKVYQKSLDLIEDAESLCTNIKGKVSGHFMNQLSRAALSVSLNIAEGNGRWHKKEKMNFYWIARGSAYECIPILHILLRKQLLNKDHFLRFYEMIEEISKMLSGLIKVTEDLDR